MHVSEIILIAAAAFMLGSIPFGVVLAKLFGLPDPRTIGSGNIGATNMLRTGNKKVALLTLLLDAGKGALAVWGAYWLLPNYAKEIYSDCIGDGCIDSYLVYPMPGAIALLMSALGHMFSPWLKFKGGKGVATILGAALASFHSHPGLVFIGVFLLIFLLTRYVSFASITALVAMALTSWRLYSWTLPSGIAGYSTGAAWLIMAAALLSIYKHRENIRRLLRGEEPKFTLRRKDKERELRL
jgi:glycerol-3-phosphate acyltransferase PlsY